MSDGSDDREGSFVGHKRPPVGTRFQKGRSGNPKGRPRGRRSTLPYENVLGRMVPVVVDGVEKMVTAEEAFAMNLSARALRGDGAAARAASSLLGKIRPAPPTRLQTFGGFRVNFVAVGSVNSALRPLKMGTLLGRYPQERIALEPWLVLAALVRLGDRRLTRAEQEVVVQATRTPKKVVWPDWWEVLP